MRKSTAGGALLRPRLTVGITQFIGGASPSVTARFAAAPASAASFTTSTALDRTRFDVAAAVDVFARKDLALRAEAFAGFSEHSEIYGGALRLALSF